MLIRARGFFIRNITCEINLISFCFEICRKQIVIFFNTLEKTIQGFISTVIHILDLISK